jgi:hypothetical protein
MCSACQGQRAGLAQDVALFEILEEVLSGLAKAFGDFERRDEPAWRQ